MILLTTLLFVKTLRIYYTFLFSSKRRARPSFVGWAVGILRNVTRGIYWKASEVRRCRSHLKRWPRPALNIWSEFDWFKTSAGKRGYALMGRTRGKKSGGKERRRRVQARRMDGQLVARRREYSLEPNGEMMSNRAAQLSQSQRSSFTGIAVTQTRFKIHSLSLSPISFLSPARR